MEGFRVKQNEAGDTQYTSKLNNANVQYAFAGEGVSKTA